MEEEINEEWRPVRGYEGLYEVSNRGRVRCLDKKYFRKRYGWQSKKGHIMACNDHGNGYKYVSFCHNGEQKNYYVHRLVANAFIPKIEGKEYVNHIDRDRGNNDVNNLEWCTVSENTKHSAPFRKKRNNCKHGEYGFAIRKRGNSYEVSLNHRYIGSFPTLEIAIQARDKYLEEIGG